MEQQGYPQGQYQQENIHLRDYWQVIMKYRWTIITFFTIIVVTVAITTFKMPPIYRATAQILIDRENPNILAIKEVVSLNVDSRDTTYYQTQYKMLQSRSLAKAVIDTLNLAHNKEFTGKKDKKENILISLKNSLINSIKNLLVSLIPPSGTQSQTVVSPIPEELQAKKESKLINAFLKKLQIVPTRDSNLVGISFLAMDPSLAANVPNTLAEQYIQLNLQLKQKAAVDASGWLNQNMQELKKKVAASEEALHSYKEQNKIVSLEEKQNIIVQKLSELNTAVTEAKTKRIGLETLYNQIEKFKNDKEAIESLPSVINNSLIQALKTDYISLLGEFNLESKKYGPKHPHIIKINSKLSTLEKKIESEVKKIISSIKIEYDIALAQEGVLVEALNNQKKEALELNRKAIQYNVLKRDAQSNKQMFEVVLNRLKETDLTRGLKTSNVRIVDRAEVPDTPEKPNKKLNLILAAIIGLFMGGGLAFFFEYLDNTIKTPEELKRYLDLSFLGPIPHIDTKKIKGISTPELITLHSSKSHISEAYKGLRTNIMFSFPDTNPKSLLVTSAGPSEGKTITSVNLAITMAQSGSKVVLIDADMRKPRVHRLLQVKNEKGISNVLIGQCPVEEALQKGPIPNLSIISCGQRPPNPSELLVSPTLKKLLEALKTKYDMIIIDSPPVAAVTDSVIISRITDGVALVIHGGVTGRDIIMRGRDLLKNANAHILGAIINNIDLAKRNYYYYYQYYYYQYYGDEEKPSDKHHKRRKKGRPSEA